MTSILLVDDSGRFRPAAEEALRHSGCEVRVAAGGTEALDLARRERPALILVSAAMEGMTGVDLCRVLKADPLSSRTPIIVAGEPGGQGAAPPAGAGAGVPPPLDLQGFQGGLRRFPQVMPREEA